MPDIAMARSPGGDTIGRRCYSPGPDLDVTVYWVEGDCLGGEVDSLNYAVCPYCQDPLCDYTCAASQIPATVELGEDQESWEHIERRLDFNHAVIGVETLFLDMAAAGLNIEDAKMKQALARTLIALREGPITDGPARMSAGALMAKEVIDKAGTGEEAELEELQVS